MFWNIFYQTCEKKGTKPNPVAKELKIASSTVTSWKNGSIPNGETLLKLADYLDVSVDYLLGRTDNPNGCSGDHITIGDIDGNYNMTVGKGETKPLQIDGLSKEMLEKFENLDFDKKVEVMALISNLSKK